MTYLIARDEIGTQGVNTAGAASAVLKKRPPWTAIDIALNPTTSIA
jgi:hypothetical protein